MTAVAFHTGLPDKQAYACRLVRKAWRQGARVMVTGDGMQLGRLDQALWLFEQEVFVPHLRLAANAPAPAHAARTPVWLSEQALIEAEATVLINLGSGFESNYGAFERVVELVSSEADDVSAGRLRWRQFVDAGVTPVNLPYSAAAD